LKLDHLSISRPTLGRRTEQVKLRSANPREDATSPSLICPGVQVGGWCSEVSDIICIEPRRAALVGGAWRFVSGRLFDADNPLQPNFTTPSQTSIKLCICWCCSASLKKQTMGKPLTPWWSSLCQNSNL